MKKVLMLLLIAVMLLSLVACKNDEVPPTTTLPTTEALKEEMEHFDLNEIDLESIGELLVERQQDGYCKIQLDGLCTPVILELEGTDVVTVSAYGTTVCVAEEAQGYSSIYGNLWPVIYDYDELIILNIWHDEIGYRKADAIIAVSKGVEKKLREFRPEYAHKMTTIHNLVDVEEIRIKAEADIPEAFDKDLFHIVSCGRVSREKGMDLAVEACAKLVATGHKNIHWWIVGGGPAEKEVRDKISALHMEDHVTMLGMKPNPYPYIKKADLYVQPSRFEGYPMTILEALVLGQPVISTSTSGAKEILINKKTGLFCEINADNLCVCIDALLSDELCLETLQESVRNQNMDQHNSCVLGSIYQLL